MGSKWKIIEHGTETGLGLWRGFYTNDYQYCRPRFLKSFWYRVRQVDFQTLLVCIQAPYKNNYQYCGGRFLESFWYMLRQIDFQTVLVCI